jgi:hypothetical protein
MTRAGHTMLVKVTLSVISIHISIAVKVTPAIFKAINRLRSAFIWAGTYKVAGGRCLVVWSKITCPCLGGGVLDLTTMGSVLHLRWAWLS